MKSGINKTVRKMDVTIYTTSDGMTFDLESRAVDHERYIQDARIHSELHSMEMGFPLFGDTLDGRWYLIANQEQIEYFTRKYVYHNNYHYVNDNPKAKIQLGDWVAVRYEYDSYGDKGHDGVYTLAYLIEQMKKYIEDAETVTVEGRY